MKIRVVDEDSDQEKYPVRPEDINVSRHFYSAFGRGEVEVAASYLVRFFQKLGGWKSFSKEDINKFWRESGGENETIFNRRDAFPFHWFNGKLLAGGWGGGKFRVTSFFIERCFKSSPNKK